MALATASRGSHEARPREDDEAREKVQATLSIYRARVREIQAQREAKPDMQAYKQLRTKYTPAESHGHIPGVQVGDTFGGRGELAILGLHTQIVRGIHCRTEKPAYAIVLAGGYQDDKDEGTQFWYTGEGGQAKGGGAKKQVEDQSFKKAGNAALVQSEVEQKPVRVFRGTLTQDKKRQYVYEGLYLVKEHKMARSLGEEQGPLVCQFLMVGVPGESRASVKVEFKAMAGSIGARLASVTLAGRGPAGRRSKKARRSVEGAEELARRREARLAAVRGRPGLVMEDVSQGKEAMPIPVFNETDKEVPLPDLQYITDYEFAEGVQEQVQPILDQEELAMRKHMERTSEAQAAEHPCGIKFNQVMRKADLQWAKDRKMSTDTATSEESYNEHGLLMVTDPCGIHECGPSCTSVKCKNNMQVTRGVRLPLEVFWTEDKGWGVRCAEELHAGAFIAAYVGGVITDAMAERLIGAAAGLDESGRTDRYLFSLDHFLNIFKEIDDLGLDSVAQEVPEHKIPPPPRPFPPHLVHAGGEGATPNGKGATPRGKGATPSGKGAEGADRGQGRAGGSASKPGAVQGTPGAAGRQAGQQGAGPCGTGGAAEQQDYSPLLVVDARERGNVARFINHACAGDDDRCANLTIQTVFAKSARSTVFYYTAFFASRLIPAKTELTYDYGKKYMQECKCGAPTCIGR